MVKKGRKGCLELELVALPHFFSQRLNCSKLGKIHLLLLNIFQCFVQEKYLVMMLNLGVHFNSYAQDGHIQSNLAIRNGLIRNKLVLRNHFLWPICHLLHKDKELMALRNNFRATKKFLIAKFDCIRAISKSHFCPHLQKNEPNHCLLPFEIK